MAILWDAVVPPVALTEFARAVPIDQNYVLNTILPDEQVESLDVEFSEGVVTTRAAKARAFDAPPRKGERDGFRTSRVRLPAVSQMLDRGESDRLQLERMRLGGTSTAAIEQQIYDDTERNTRSILTKAEIMRGDLLNDGKVTLPELGGMEADFGVPAGHFVAPAIPWTNHASATVLANLQAWNRVYRATNGFGLGPMNMSEDTLYDMLQNQEIRTLWATVAGSTGVVTIQQLNSTLAANRCPTIGLVYDAQALDDGNTISILDPAKVIFTPPPGIALGRTRWGMSATALELQAGGVEVEGSPAGIVAVVDKDPTPPYREASYADSTCLPYLSLPRGLFVATVR